MNSVDTNILYYGTNSDCAEHIKALSVIEQMAKSPRNWIIADQVLFEFYRLVRNSAVLEHPLTAEHAARRVRFFHDEIGCLHCAYDRFCWAEVIELISTPSFPASRTFDVVLAVTLKRNGVNTLYTHNARDFEVFDFFSVIDPVT